jgi:hypothetical protein
VKVKVHKPAVVVEIDSLRLAQPTIDNWVHLFYLPAIGYSTLHPIASDPTEPK